MFNSCQRKNVKIVKNACWLFYLLKSQKTISVCVYENKYVVINTSKQNVKEQKNSDILLEEVKVQSA